MVNLDVQFDQIKKCIQELIKHTSENICEGVCKED